MDCNHAFRLRETALAAALFLGTAAHAAPKKKAPVPASTVAEPETVFVRQPAAPASSPSSERERLRPFKGAFGVSGGLYAADVLGNSPFGYFSYDFYPLPAINLFIEGNAGIGPAQSGFSKKVIGARQFDPNLLLNLEILAGFNFMAPKGVIGNSGGLFPYVVLGVAGLYQGDVPNVGMVLGFGQRVAIPWTHGARNWALNYGVRDQIYSQKIKSEPSLTQNPVVHVGLLLYY